MQMKNISIPKENVSIVGVSMPTPTLYDDIKTDGYSKISKVYANSLWQALAGEASKASKESAPEPIDKKILRLTKNAKCKLLQKSKQNTVHKPPKAQTCYSRLFSKNGCLVCLLNYIWLPAED